MTTIVTRAGKGSPLTHTEVDTNFTNLNTAKLETAAIPLGTLGAPSISFLSYSTTGIYSPAGDELGVSMLGLDKIRIKSTGEIIINATASRTTLGITPRLQIEGSASSSQCSMSLTGAGAGSSLIPRLYLSKARSSVNAVVLEDDILGFILFNGGDGSSLVNAGFIKAEVDGTPSAGIVPGRLVFATVDTAGGSGERMIIKNNGNVSIDGTTFNVDAVNNRVGIGTSDVKGTLGLQHGNTSPQGLTDVAIDALRISQGAGGIVAIRTTQYDAANQPAAGDTQFFNLYFNGSTYNYYERMRIRADGRVGIGSTGPDYNLQVAGTNPTIAINATNASASSVSTLLYRNVDGNGNTRNVASIEGESTANGGYGALAFHTAFNNSLNERFRCDADGRLLVGTSTARTDYFNNSLTAMLQVEGINASGAVDRACVSIVNNNNATLIESPVLILGRSNGSTVNSKTIVSNGTRCGYITFQGADGSDLIDAANITGEIDGAPAANVMPGRLVFSTNSGTANASPTERMRIDSTGVVHIGQGAWLPNTGYFQLTPKVTSGSGSYYFYDDSTGFFPYPDNSQKLGNPSYKWTTIYATNGTINTSDANTKQQIRTLSDAEKAVAQSIKGLIRAYKFNDSVAEKGDGARIHVGVIAQDVQAAFVAEGLDASKYSLFCSDTWYEVDGEARSEDEGFYTKDTPNAIQVSRLGIRYDELLAFVLAVL